MSTPLNKSPYLRNQRAFPTDPEMLSVETNKSYVDISNAVNSRTISQFATATLSTGEQWFTTSPDKPLSGFRKIFPISSTGNTPHGLSLARISSFVRIWGSFTDGTIWYPLPYVDVTGVTSQISITVDATNIIITSGAGAPPTISSGIVTLEWIA